MSNALILSGRVDEQKHRGHLLNRFWSHPFEGTAPCTASNGFQIRILLFLPNSCKAAGHKQPVAHGLRINHLLKLSIATWLPHRLYDATASVSLHLPSISMQRCPRHLFSGFHHCVDGGVQRLEYSGGICLYTQ